VTRLAEWLEGHGVKVWFDHDIDYGARWKAEIQKQLDASTVVLVVMSKSARRPSWVDRELDRAKKRQILVFPVLLEPDGIVDRVADLQFENVVGGRMPGLRLCQKLPGFLVSEMDIANGLTAELVLAHRAGRGDRPARRARPGPVPRGGVQDESGDRTPHAQRLHCPGADLWPQGPSAGRCRLPDARRLSADRKGPDYHTSIGGIGGPPQLGRSRCIGVSPASANPIS
jgi:TIR domain